MIQLATPFLSSIHQKAICGCESIETIYLPALYEVAYGGFDGCKQLKQFFAPKLRNIGEYTF